MKVFCPNCGNVNEGNAGARLTCAACTATFDVPGGDSPPPQPKPAPAPIPQAAPPPVSGWLPPPTARPQDPIPQQPRQMPTAPTASWDRPAAGGGMGMGAAQTNPLAIVSLVAGIICCIPLVSPGVAIGCGIAAIQQIDKSNGQQQGKGLAIAGIILGSLVGFGHLISLLGQLFR